MSDRITQSDLEAVCRRINRTVNGSELPAYQQRAGGYIQVPDAYHISYAYGGAALYRNCSEGPDGQSRGVHDVFGYHMPKRELYNRMQAFLTGIEATS